MQRSYSFIILTHNRLDLLKKCLESISENTKNCSWPTIEILICLNGEDTKTYTYLKSIQKEFLYLKRAVRVGEARNLLIQKAKGEYLIFIDDDVILPFNYLSKGNKFLNDTSCEIFGGPDQSYKVKSLFQETLNTVMRTYLAMGPTKYRHTSTQRNIKGNEVHLILCNLWVKREVFIKIKFPKKYIRNEENVFLYLAKEQGYSIEYFNDLNVYHFRKSNFKKLMISTFRSGQFRMISFFDYPKSLNILFLVPLIAILLGSTLLFLSPKVLMVLVIVYLFLITISILNAFKFNLSFKKFTYALRMYLIYNWVYGIGLLWGIFKRN